MASSLDSANEYGTSGTFLANESRHCFSFHPMRPVASLGQLVLVLLNSLWLLNISGFRQSPIFYIPLHKDNSRNTATTMEEEFKIVRYLF